MITPMNETIDLDLIDQIVDLIPSHTWSVVREGLITTFVDNMPADIVERLTGDPVNFDRAEEILYSFYDDDKNKELIIDSFKILGQEHTVYLLDSWQLDKIQKKDEVPSVL